MRACFLGGPATEALSSSSGSSESEDRSMTWHGSGETKPYRRNLRRRRMMRSGETEVRMTAKGQYMRCMIHRKSRSTHNAPQYRATWQMSLAQVTQIGGLDQDCQYTLRRQRCRIPSPDRPRLGSAWIVACAGDGERRVCSMPVLSAPGSAGGTDVPLCYQLRCWLLSTGVSMRLVIEAYDG